MTASVTKRRKHYVDRQVQGAIVRRLAVHWISFLLVGSAVSLVVQFFLYPFQSMPELAKAFLQHQAGFIAVMVCMTPIFLYDTVKLTNRFAGPVLRLRRALNDLARHKQTDPLRFRSDDFWSEMADDFNHVLNQLAADSSGRAADQPVNDEFANVTGTR